MTAYLRAISLDRAGLLMWSPTTELLLTDTDAGAPGDLRSAPTSTQRVR